MNENSRSLFADTKHKKANTKREQASPVSALTWRTGDSKVDLDNPKEGPGWPMEKRKSQKRQLFPLCVLRVSNLERGNTNLGGRWARDPSLVGTCPGATLAWKHCLAACLEGQGSHSGPRAARFTQESPVFWREQCWHPPGPGCQAGQSPLPCEASALGPRKAWFCSTRISETVRATAFSLKLENECRGQSCSPL